MANGDAAFAAGMDVVAATDDKRLGYDEINKSRDYIANDRTTARPVSAGGTGANNPATARTNLGIIASNIPSNGATGSAPGSNVQADLQFLNGKADNALAANADTQSYVDNHGPRITNLENGDLNGVIWGRDLSGIGVGEKRSTYMTSDGLLGFLSSTRRVKCDVVPATGLLGLLTCGPVKYRRIAAVAELGDAAPTEYGLLAEDVAAAGLEAFVWRDEEGRPAGIDYAALVVPLLAIVRDQEQRIRALEAPTEPPTEEAAA